MRHMLQGLLKGSAYALLAAPCRCSSVLLACLDGCEMRCGLAAAHFIFCGIRGMEFHVIRGKEFHARLPSALRCCEANLQAEAAVPPCTCCTSVLLAIPVYI